MNSEQEHLNHPYLDRIRELRKQRSNLETQKQAINVQLNQINIERIELEQKQKDVNRLFHDLKHELIVMNPRENFVRKE